MLKPIAKSIGEALKGPSTLEFPEEKEGLADNYRGIHKLDMPTCISCSACERICPNKCIEMVEVDTDKGIKKMPEIHLERCLFCALCEEICPPECLTLTKSYDFERYDRREYTLRPEDQK